jgi:peptidyl-prolyl cis-trans isomerase A (cyclophilin A)
MWPSFLLLAAQQVVAAPGDYRVRFDATPGSFVVQVRREWAPLGADRFKELVEEKYYDSASFFRVIPGFMAQFGIAANPVDSRKWANQRLIDDPVKHKNTRGRISFAMGGKNTRTTQCFINFGDNSRLDPEGFTPFGEVVEGMDVVDKLYSGYGEEQPNGKGPKQGLLWQDGGQKYLQDNFPRMSYIKQAVVLTDDIVGSETAVAVQKVHCETTKGPIRITIHPEWAPNGAARFHEMITDGYFNRIAFYRVIPGFLTQFGLGDAGDPEMRKKWRQSGTINDDKKVLAKFPRGGISFAGNGKNSRTTQLFISYSTTTGLGRCSSSAVVVQ